MLWLVLKYYGISFKDMFVGTVIIIMFINFLYWPHADLKLIRKYPDDFIQTGKWPILKKKNSVPEWVKRKHRRFMLIWYSTIVGLLGLLFAYGAAAMHFHW